MGIFDSYVFINYNIFTRKIHFVINKNSFYRGLAAVTCLLIIIIFQEILKDTLCEQLKVIL